MSSSAVAPATINGDVISPSAVADPRSSALHSFLNVVRDLVLKGGAFHSEADQNAALDAVDQFSAASIVPSVLNMLLQETPTLAGREDVSLRIPPNVSAVPAQVQGQPIDYNRLAAAIVAAERAAKAADEASAAAPVTVVTDMPETGQE